MPLSKVILVILLLWAVPVGLAGAAPVQEDLPYRIGLGAWKEVGLAKLSFKEIGPGRYLAEFTGAAKGVWSLLSRWLPERYRTEMVLKDGRLLPLVFREELWYRGRRVVKEYRFDYEKGLMEYWRSTDNQKSGKRWEVPLKEPIYDLLSLLYNFRIGAFGPLTGGQTLRVKTIPTPAPEELIINLGPETDQGRKVMLTVREKSGNERGPFFIYVGPQSVPQTAWTRVLAFGKLTGQLLDPGAITPLDQLPLAGPPLVGRLELK